LRPGRRSLTWPKWNDSVAHVRDPYKPAVWLLVYTGIRPAELCGLRVRSINFPRRDGQCLGDTDASNRFEELCLPVWSRATKTEAGTETFRYRSGLCDDIAAMLAARANARGGPVSLGRALCSFADRIPTANRDSSARTSSGRRFRAAGLPERLRTYDLRSTAMRALLIDQEANSRRGAAPWSL